MNATAHSFIVNLDVPDLAAAEDFYIRAFGLRIGRRLGPGAVELLGGPTPLYLLHNDAALARAVAAGATLEQSLRERRWGRIAVLADPFGHGFCLIQFSAEGYDALVE